MTTSSLSYRTCSKRTQEEGETLPFCFSIRKGIVKCFYESKFKREVMSDETD